MTARVNLRAQEQRRPIVQEIGAAVARIGEPRVLADLCDVEHRDARIAQLLKGSASQDSATAVMAGDR